ncbi:TOBE domain-containing protein [Caldichromatium japonicum]|uniref:TOBE domain-containing protein n=1 Tax=Caldichromatium japonicum TaxID=2699430 RepID=UPI0031B63F4A
MAIARTLLTKPRLLLMDEPLGALDVARKREILPYLEHLHETLKIPVLYVSHAPEEVARLVDHLVALEGRRVIASGPLAETLTRLDLLIRLGENAGVVLAGAPVERDPDWHLARIELPGGISLWARDEGYPLGKQVRVRVLARDVSLSHAELLGSSIFNHFPLTVQEITPDVHPALCLARVAVGEQWLLARLTRRSAESLALKPEDRVWAQLKVAGVLV